MRGDDPFYLRCGATLKHFYGNNQEKDRVRTSSSIDPRNKKEYYLEPFRRAVEAGAEAVAYGLKAGVDCFTDDGKAVEAAAREALERGLITWEDVDRSIRNSFRTRIRLGQTLSIGGVKIPPRNAESVTKADHYDDCKGAVLYQGHDSKCAVYAKTETAELLYRDFVFEKTPRKIHVLFQGEGSGTVELYAAEQGLCTGKPETAAESENIGGAVLKKNLLLRQNCDNSGKPVWKEYLLNEDAVENLPTGKKMDLLIRLKGGAGIAEYCFSD